jgi:aspartyl-tRNA(Asn)/glutamyl-tRNA(Gln) amidotransferase subunit B
MEKGSMRADVNVSACAARASRKFGTRCEIKNVNSFRFIHMAIEYEARRQIDILEDGGKIDQETRLFDPDKGETRSMRSKEDAHDYRYFPDPDLLPLELDGRIHRSASKRSCPNCRTRSARFVKRVRPQGIRRWRARRR